MIDEREILKELNGMIEAQNRNIEYAEQFSNETVVHLESRELAAYIAVRDMIKEKCTPEAATPEGADINSLSQVHYSTESEKEQ